MQSTCSRDESVEWKTWLDFEDHGHKKRKDSLETWSILLIFSLELKHLEWLYKKYMKTAKHGNFVRNCSVKMTWRLSHFLLLRLWWQCFWGSSEEGYRSKNDHKSSSCLIVFSIIAKIYQSVKQWKKISYLLTRTPPA